MRYPVFSVMLLLSITACGRVREQADVRFQDQHFKTAVALIELHKLRFGAYPSSLSELRFLGDWDQLALSSVRYRPFEGGYELDIVNSPREGHLGYPREFWMGLGLRRSNVGVTAAPDQP